MQIQYIHNKCKSNKVEELSWVNMNTGEIGGSADTDENDFWCKECQEHFGYDELEELDLDVNT